LTHDATLLDLATLVWRAREAGFTLARVDRYQVVENLVRKRGDGEVFEIRVLADGRVRVFAFSCDPSTPATDEDRRRLAASFHTWDLEQCEEIELMPSPHPRREEDHRVRP